MSSDLEGYIKLIDSFLNNQITALDFERMYLDRFKNDTSNFSNDEYAALNDLFSDVDAFCADPELRDSEDLDEMQLRQQCNLAVERLREIYKASVK